MGLWKCLYQAKYWQNWQQHIFKKVSGTDLDWGDLFIPWRATPQKTINRYYHAFTPGGLKQEIKLANFKIVELTKLRRQKKLVGWAIVAKKTVDNLP